MHISKIFTVPFAYRSRSCMKIQQVWGREFVKHVHFLLFLLNFLPVITVSRLMPFFLIILIDINVSLASHRALNIRKLQFFEWLRWVSSWLRTRREEKYRVCQVINIFIHPLWLYALSVRANNEQQVSLIMRGRTNRGSSVYSMSLKWWRRVIMSETFWKSYSVYLSCLIDMLKTHFSHLFTMLIRTHPVSFRYSNSKWLPSLFRFHDNDYNRECATLICE